MLSHHEALRNKNIVRSTACSIECDIECNIMCDTMSNIMCSSVCNVMCDKNIVSTGQRMTQSFMQCRVAWLVALHYDSRHATHSIRASIHISKPSTIVTDAVAAYLRPVLAQTLGQGLRLLSVPGFCLHLSCGTSSGR